MKYFLSLLMLVAAMSLTAQNTRQSMSETCEEDSYRFKLEVSKDKADQLQRVYNELTDQPADRKITGLASHDDFSGMVIELNTRKNSLLISYEGADEERYKAAKALGVRVKESFGTPAPPPPPRGNK